MLLIECNQIKKYFGDRLILDIDHLKIYSDDRIGIVGRNGVGKTTLINILSKRLEPDEGWVKTYGRAAYVSQLEAANKIELSSEMASRFGIKTTWDNHMSGGEKTRFKLAAALEQDSEILFADEPTSNLDIDGIELVEEMFEKYKGALIVISHDRSFLDKLCSQIIDIEDSRIKIYKGNYSDYKEQKTQERKRAQFEYEEYIREKRRLEKVIQGTKEKVKSIKKPPKRMGNSEARLHKMGGQKAKANLEKAIKNIEKRIEHLEVKEKPKKQAEIKFDIMDSNRLHSKLVIEGKNLNKAFGHKVIFNHADFSIYNGAKVALIGPNGCGKSTLVKMIMNREAGIRIAQGAEIGYFSQDMNLLKQELSIIENVMETSIYPESFARLLLARLLFREEAVYKKVAILSGGERVKVAFAKIVLQDINLLILDEPTNYMDINSLEVMEETLKEYDRTLLFISHDRRFVDAIANQIMTIENKKIKVFAGNYTEYMESIQQSTDDRQEEVAKRIIVLENRLSELIGRLSMPSKTDDIVALDQEYYRILNEIKKLRG